MIRRSCDCCEHKKAPQPFRARGGGMSLTENLFQNLTDCSRALDRRSMLAHYPFIQAFKQPPVQPHIDRLTVN